MHKTDEAANRLSAPPIQPDGQKRQSLPGPTNKARPGLGLPDSPEIDCTAASLPLHLTPGLVGQGQELKANAGTGNFCEG